MMISVVATGFGPFPGAPVNPTEELMRQLAVNPPLLGDDVAFQSFVLPTEYAGLDERLRLIGAMARPDIAIHFGLAHSASGFRLERLARNRLEPGRVDAAGGIPASAVVVEGAPDLDSTLPLARIETALRAHGLPVVFSDDCGAYLCNAIFYQSRGGLVEAFQPEMAGFVHVPATSPSFTAAQLEDGARLILAETVAAWRESGRGA